MTKYGRKRTPNRKRAGRIMRRLFALIVAVATLGGFYSASGTPMAKKVFQRAAASEEFVSRTLGFELGRPKGASVLLESLGLLRTMAVAESAVLLGSEKEITLLLGAEHTQSSDSPAHVEESEWELDADADILVSASQPPEQGQVNSEGIVEKTLIPVSSDGYEFADGIYVRNGTTHSVNVAALMSEKLAIKLKKDEPQVLIIHTHGSEAYTPDGDDIYVPTDTDRTENMKYNVVRIGDEMAEVFENMGISAVHDRALYDYPSYSGSYTRSLEAIEKYLKNYPSIQFVFDIHRDAIEGSDGTTYKVVSTVGDQQVAQVMLVIGTNDSGLEHPNWKENLKLAIRIQAKLNKDYPTLARPISLRTARFNQHATTGSMIVEVGTNGNTLQEALAGVRCFAKSAAAVIKDLK